MTSGLGQIALIGVDWGLTHLRAYCIDDEGGVMERRESPAGIMAIADRDFTGALSSLIAEWLAEDAELPMFLCGMIGSRNGWREAPYCQCPAILRDVADNAAVIDVAGHAAHLVGGLTFTDERGRHDVIRGEETQIFGVAGAHGTQLVVTPGTHSKWIFVREARIEQFRTYMTGEMYAVLRQHSSLGWWARDAKAEVSDWTSFLDGVHASLADPDLLHALFTVRTRALFKDRPANAHAAYLSGVLIGHEVESGLRLFGREDILLLGAPELTNLYRTALSACGANQLDCISGDEAVARGLWRIWKSRVSQ